jgi:hypothetical protein
MAVAARRLHLCRGPTRIGTMMFIFTVSIASESESSSHGCATAVGVAGSTFTVEMSF